MVVIRPVAPGDLDALEQIAYAVGTGMTTLPKQRDLLEQKITHSCDSFSRTVEHPGDERYLLALEDGHTGQLVGLSSVIATVGVDQPFYSFRMMRLTHASHELGRYESVRALQMVEAYRGSSEVGSLYVTPEYRKDGNGRFMSRARFLLIAEFSDRFSERIIAEMRGSQDRDGHAPFWDAVGKHFLKMDFPEADHLSAMGKYRFIANMMPKHPLYVRMLPESAQQVIGVPHASSLPAMKLLEKEGFHFENCVDVFDGGPTVHCHRDLIYTVRASHRAEIVEIRDGIEGTVYMAATTNLDGFRMARGVITETEQGICIDSALARALKVDAGAALRYIKL